MPVGHLRHSDICFTVWNRPSHHTGFWPSVPSDGDEGSAKNAETNFPSNVGHRFSIVFLFADKRDTNR